MEEDSKNSFVKVDSQNRLQRSKRQIADVRLIVEVDSTDKTWQADCSGGF